MEVDLKKAYDSINLVFLEKVMLDVEFNNRFVEWIMDYVLCFLFYLDK